MLMGVVYKLSEWISGCNDDITFFLSSFLSSFLGSLDRPRMRRASEKEQSENCGERVAVRVEE